METHLKKTEQEIFNIAVAGLASQGFERSVDEDGDCMYRGRNGRRCAVGWLIPDERYKKDFEHTAASGFSDQCERVREAAGISHLDPRWIGYLQDAHDFADSPADMKSDLLEFAFRHNLTTPEVLNT